MLASKEAVAVHPPFLAVSRLHVRLLSYSHSMGFLRPATPGFIVTLIATIILAIVVFCVPYVKSVYFLKASITYQNVSGNITFGTLGYCVELSGNTTCSNPSIGYELGLLFISYSQSNLRHCLHIRYQQFSRKLTSSQDSTSGCKMAHLFSFSPRYRPRSRYRFSLLWPSSPRPRNFNDLLQHLLLRFCSCYHPHRLYLRYNPLFRCKI